jgi:hypothetical protein
MLFLALRDNVLDDNEVKTLRNHTLRAKNLRCPPIQHSPHGLKTGTISTRAQSNPNPKKRLTVALKLIPTVLALTAKGLSTKANTIQKNAVTKVLPASDHRLPNGDSTMYAPSCK